MEPSPTTNEPVQPAPVALNTEKLTLATVVTPVKAGAEYADRCALDALSHGEAPVTTTYQWGLSLNAPGLGVTGSRLSKAWIFGSTKLAVYLDYGLTRDMEECIQHAFLHSKALEFRWMLKGGNKMEKMLKQGMELHVCTEPGSERYGICWRPGTFTRLPIWLVNSKLCPAADLWDAELRQSVGSMREAGLVHPVSATTFGSELMGGGDGHVTIYKWHTFKD